MRVVAVIPAHLASARFPRKILYPIFGLPMIEHVRRRALLSSEITDVFVATCDDEIATAMRKFGANVIMTSKSHVNGTSRVAEAVSELPCSHVLLLQGDEPLLLPKHLGSLVKAMEARPEGDAWNATGPIDAADELERHSFVKCAVSKSNRILLCFRRSPFFCSSDEQKMFVRKILGIISFRKEFLLELNDLESGAIEQVELIEQMRIIESGYDLQSVPVEESLPSVNEPGEVEVVLDFIQRDRSQQKLLSQILDNGESPMSQGTGKLC